MTCRRIALTLAGVGAALLAGVSAAAAAPPSLPFPVPLPTVPTSPIPPIPSTLPPLPLPLDPDGPASDEPVTVTLAPNGSPVSGTLTITGRQVAGSATGLTPGTRYISLYYGSQSTAQPGQTFTCADARTAVFPRAWGITPEWTVADDGSGTLAGTAPRDLADGVYTVSIREVPALAPTDPYLIFNPAQYPVRACGAVPQAS